MRDSEDSGTYEEVKFVMQDKLSFDKYDHVKTRYFQSDQDIPHYQTCTEDYLPNTNLRSDLMKRRGLFKTLITNILILELEGTYISRDLLSRLLNYSL